MERHTNRLPSCIPARLRLIKKRARQGPATRVFETCSTTNNPAGHATATSYASPKSSAIPTASVVAPSDSAPFIAADIGRRPLEKNCLMTVLRAIA